MGAVEFLGALFARGVELGAVCGNDVVAAVGGGVEDGFVLAHEGEGYGGGDAAEGAWVAADVEVVPGAGVGEARLGDCVSCGVVRGCIVCVRGELLEGPGYGRAEVRWGMCTLPMTCDIVWYGANGQGNRLPSVV